MLPLLPKLLGDHKGVDYNAESLTSEEINLISMDMEWHLVKLDLLSLQYIWVWILAFFPKFKCLPDSKVGLLICSHLWSHVKYKASASHMGIIFFYLLWGLVIVKLYTFELKGFPYMKTYGDSIVGKWLIYCCKNVHINFIFAATYFYLGIPNTNIFSHSSIKK